MLGMCIGCIGFKQQFFTDASSACIAVVTGQTELVKRATWGVQNVPHQL